MSLDAIFTSTATAPRLDLDVEVEHVAAVKEGSTRAFLALAEAYAPRLRAAAGAARHALPDDDERRHIVALAFHAAVLETEPGKRVATVVRFAMTDFVNKAASEERGGLAVPHGTAYRYFSILSAAGGDHEAALALAPKKGMSRTVFLAVRDAVQGGPSIEALASHDDGGADGVDERFAVAQAPNSPSVTVERAMLARQALSAVEGTEKEVVLLAYGFTEPEPVPDAEIAHRLGMGRTGVWKARMRALDKMRAALGA